MLYETNECLSFVRWYKYFHSLKYEIFYSTWLRLMKISVPSNSQQFIICRILSFDGILEVAGNNVWLTST